MAASRLSGELQSPEISKTFGAYTIDFKYDETTADTIQYSFVHHDALKMKTQVGKPQEQVQLK
ncbi:MAG: hypothetical protein IPO65_20950 [Saprospiraceae bacterium]|nr:hypothetical protein [Saprospiraceae bacterium]